MDSLDELVEAYEEKRNGAPQPFGRHFDPDLQGTTLFRI
jgi:hypothetical protein